MMRKFLIAATAATLSPAAAFAHTGHAEVSGFTSGLLHPITGPDHLLAMLAIGLIAAMSGGRMLWALPAAFLGTMLLGALVGLSGFALPGVEMWILASVVVLGLVAVLPAGRLPQVPLLVAAGLFGLSHGFAHGAEAPSAGSVAGYLIGFTLATAALHGAGMLLGRSLPRLVARGAGLTIALAGLGLAMAG